MSATLWFLLEFTALLAAAAVVFTWLGWFWGRRGAPQPESPAPDPALPARIAELEAEKQSLLENSAQQLQQHREQLEALRAEHRESRQNAEKRLQDLQTAFSAQKAETDALREKLAQAETSLRELESRPIAPPAPQPAAPPPPPAAKPAAPQTELFPQLGTLAALVQERDAWQRRVTALESKTPRDPAGLALARRSLEGSQKRLDEAQSAAAAVESRKRVLQKALEQAAQLPPGAEDDLTRIKGIKKVLRDKLHAHGIRTFRQIADWTEEDLHAFSEILAFKNRATRDKWQEQARELLAAPAHS
jgi:predicted flap endonuclease-1-like 5' DNA nuclease